MRETFMHTRLEDRKSKGLLRSLKDHATLIDFCSNDYLGFARNEKLKSLIRETMAACPNDGIGATGSRLLSGNTGYCEELERSIAHFHDAEAGLIFNSGYDANVGLFASVPGRDDLILYDELIHASVHDGMRLSKADRRAFRHNDLNDLEALLKDARNSNKYQEIFVAVETLYSMDGDRPPLKEVASLCEISGANLIADEAHATGVIGEKGQGLVQELFLQKRCFARLHTFGKAMGCHGAILLGSNLLREYLINFARPFIYTTALPKHSLVSIRCVYDFLAVSGNIRLRLLEQISFFMQRISSCENTRPGLIPHLDGFPSPVFSVLIPGNESCRSVAGQIQHAGFDVRPILSPTVQAGRERLRICIHAFNSEGEMGDLLDVLEKNLTSITAASQ